jgi:hypothetical protein
MENKHIARSHIGMHAFDVSMFAFARRNEES